MGECTIINANSEFIIDFGKNEQRECTVVDFSFNFFENVINEIFI